MSRREDISNAVWSDPDFHALSPDAKLLYLWSFTNQHCNMSGLYKVPAQVMGFETALGQERSATALAELQAAEFLFYEEQVMLIRSRVKHLRTRSVQIARSVAHDVAAIRPTHPLRRRFLEMYGDDPWLRQELSATLGRPSTEPHEKADAVGDQLNLTGTSPEVPGLGQGLRQGQRPTSKAAERKRRARVDQTVLPANFPAELTNAAAEVLGVLADVYAERGGIEPTLRGVGLVLRRYPKRDHRMIAHDLEHYSLAGNGQARDLSDVVRLYGTFVRRAPEGTPTRTRPANGQVESSAAYLGRRGAS